MEFYGYDTVVIRRNPNAERDNKRLIAYFIFSNGRMNAVKFGQHNPKRGTFADGIGEKERQNWIARHKPEKGKSIGGNNLLILKPKMLSFITLWETFSKSNKKIEEYLKSNLKADYVSVRFPRMEL